MRRAAFISTLSYCLVPAIGVAQPDARAFESYPAAEIWTGPAARPQLTSAFLASYRNLLVPASRRPVNFAGRYRLETWFASNGCFRGAAIDLKTGSVGVMPLDLCGKAGHSRRVTFRANSKLVAVADSAPGTREPVRYFAFDDAKFADVTQTVTKTKPDDMRPPLAPSKTDDPSAPAAAASIKTTIGSTRSVPLASTSERSALALPEKRTPLPVETTTSRQILTFNACGTTWGYFIDAANQANVSLVLQGLDKGPTVVLHVKSGATAPDLSGVKDAGQWNLDLTVPPFGQEAMSRIAYSGRMLYVSLSFDQGKDNTLILRGFGFNDTGKPCPPSPRPTAQSQ